ncbi:MAG: M20/M25/M40 family metallo-hydrolase [Sedimentibacter sp.]
MNALLAANNIISGFYNIPRHSQGATLINVGVINAGSFRSAIPENAELQVEVRGENNELSGYMYEKAFDIVHNISKAYGCQYKILEAGSSLSEDCSPELVDIVYDVAHKTGIYHNIYKTRQINGSEDFTYFMKHVKNNGGQATYMLWGADIKDSFHSSHFDFSEESMVKALTILCELLKNISMGD